MTFRRSVAALFVCVACLTCAGRPGFAEDDFPYPQPLFLQDAPWGAAFDALHAKLSAEYAYTDWKGIDWAGLYGRFRPRIAAAESAGDEEAYYTALRGYAFSIPDGHIIMGAGRMAEIGAQKLAGGFGFTIARLFDRRVIVNYVVPGSAAAAGGLKRGAEVIAWNGEPVRRALSQTSIVWRPESDGIATRDHLRLDQLRYLVRAPVGARAVLTFRNRGEQRVRRLRLAAVDDRGDGLLRSYLAAMNFSDALVEHRVLGERVGYVRVQSERDAVVEEFAAALTDLLAQGVRRLVLDLRGNIGGSDDMAAALAGFFHRQPRFYEYQSFYNTETGRYERHTTNDASETVDHISITPHTPYFGGRVVVLINPGTISSGEGVALGLKRSVKAKLLGFYGTNGSFGMVCQAAILPGPTLSMYPCGRSLDKDGVIQLDSRRGKGGVQPDIRLRLSERAAINLGRGVDVELGAALRALGNDRLWPQR